MRLAVFSDSHNITSLLKEGIEEVYKRKKVDMFIFLGDGLGDFYALRSFMLSLNPEAQIVAIRGNNDMLHTNDVDDRVLSINGVNLFLTHGHKCLVKISTHYLAKEARERNCAIALYGHTHTKDISDKGGVWLMNPGSTNFMHPSALVIDIEDDGSFTPELIDI